MKQRVRIVFGGCPHCHGKLLVLEKAAPTDDADEVLPWRIVSGRCAGKCLLVPADWG